MANYEPRIHNYIDKETGIHIVKATAFYACQPISAVAKCDPADTFDLDLGVKIALTRLKIKIAKKRQAGMKAWAKSTAKYLNQLKLDEKRARKTKEYAELNALDRKVEIKKLEAELVELTKGE